MTRPVLIVKSARAFELAHKIAQREQCSLDEAVERALEYYDKTSSSTKGAAGVGTMGQIEPGSGHP